MNASLKSLRAQKLPLTRQVEMDKQVFAQPEANGTCRSLLPARQAA